MSGEGRGVEPLTAAVHGIAAGAPQWGGARVHIRRPSTRQSGYCGVVLRQRWVATETRPVTCKRCIREEATDDAE